MSTRVDGGDALQGREVVSNGKRKLLSHDFPLLIFNILHAIFH